MNLWRRDNKRASRPTVSRLSHKGHGTLTFWSSVSKRTPIRALRSFVCGLMAGTSSIASRNWKLHLPWLRTILTWRAPIRTCPLRSGRFDQKPTRTDVAPCWLASAESWRAGRSWARVLVGKNTVTWLDFKQPFRPRWSYATLGPFVFDRAQYQAELAKIGCAMASNPL